MRRGGWATIYPRRPERCVVFNAGYKTKSIASLNPTAPTPTGMDALLPGQAVPLIWEKVAPDCADSCECF